MASVVDARAHQRPPEAPGVYDLRLPTSAVEVGPSAFFLVPERLVIAADVKEIGEIDHADNQESGRQSQDQRISPTGLPPVLLTP